MRQAGGRIYYSAADIKSLKLTTESDVDIVRFGSFTDLDDGSFSLIGYVRMKRLPVRGARWAINAAEWVVAFARGECKRMRGTSLA